MPTTRELRQQDPVAGRLTDELPTIDASLLLNPDRFREATDAVRKASLDTGFFYVTNVFTENSADGGLLVQMQSFFDLNDDDPVKQSVRAEHSEYGWIPVGGEPPYQPGTVAHIESFDLGPPADEDNFWPEISGFRSDVETYWRTATELGNTILRHLAIVAGLDEMFLVDKCSTHELSTMRLLNYPKNDVAADDINVGISAHTDFECISLLYQTAPGLELTDTGGRWHDTPATDGGLFVLLDDMLEFWTNGFFKATGHRVRHTNERRFSIVIFMAVDDGITIQPLPKFAGLAPEGRYPAITQEEHIEAELARARANRKAE